MRNSSIRCTISEGLTSSSSESLMSVRMVGLRSPRSSRLTNVRSNPASRASFSWEMFRALRNSCSALPNAFSGPPTGLCLRRACSKQPMLIRYGQKSHGQ